MKSGLSCNGFRGSEITLYGEIPPQLPMEKQDKMQPRPKLKTNGHFTAFMQVRCPALLNAFIYLNHIKYPVTC